MKLTDEQIDTEVKRYRESLKTHQAEPEPTAAELKEADDRRHQELAQAMGFSQHTSDTGNRIMREGRRAFDPNYNAANNKRRVGTGADVVEGVRAS